MPEFVSLDGVMESPEEWAFSYSNAEMEEAHASGMAESDALLMGRVTYEQMATYWPNQPGGTPMVDDLHGVLPGHAAGGLRLYASNAAAISGGLGVGRVYRNGDALQIVH